MRGNAVLKHDCTADNVRLQPNTDAHHKRASLFP